MFAWRTVSLRDDLEVALEAEASGETADFSPSVHPTLMRSGGHSGSVVCGWMRAATTSDSDRHPT